MTVRQPVLPRTLPALVELRAQLRRGLGRHPSWAAREARVADSLRAYFAAAPPELRRIEADSPREVLAWIVRHEAVHAIHGLRDLQRRLDRDRRCYALVSAAMPDEPLAFTELALTRGIRGDVNSILESHGAVADPASCDCAMFYSISSCHEGLRGVPFGNMLIRRAVSTLQAELPPIRTFATVSPVPGFRSWLADLALRTPGRLSELVALLDEGGWRDRPDQAARLEAELPPLCAWYLLHAKRGVEPLDAVARFHLGNGARLERINWLGDTSVAGLKRSAGITANYFYDLGSVDANTAGYDAGGIIAAAPQVTRLVSAIAIRAA